MQPKKVLRCVLPSRTGFSTKTARVLDFALNPRRNSGMSTPTANSVSIAVVGANAVGCYYGVRLAEAGYDVRFLVRHNFDTVRKEGMRITSHLGDFHLESPTLARSTEELAEYGTVDWLIVALESYDLDQLLRLATPLLASESRILAIVNGIGIENDIAAQMHRYGIFGGIGFIGVGQPAPGRIAHREFGALDIGHHGDDSQAVEEAVALWTPTVVAARPADCLARARWQKMIWDVPFNGLSVAAGGATSGFILETPALNAFARRVMDEIGAIANADLEDRGLPPFDDVEALCERAMRLMGTTENYIPPAGVDFVRQQPLEVEALFARPARRAAELGVDAPMTDFLAALLQRLNPAATL